MDMCSWIFIAVFGTAFVFAVTYSIVQHLRNIKTKSRENCDEVN